MPAGPLLPLRAGALEVDIAAHAGGRIARIRMEGVEQLIGPQGDAHAMIAWGSYPMVPWAGRIRDGRFRFGGRQWQLPRNLGAHAIHGVGFGLPWGIDHHDAHSATLSLALPQDERWPFGGVARQTLRLEPRALQLTLSVQAGDRSMPAVIGWHPWFRKPDRLDFDPRLMYPRDAQGIATLPPGAASPGPWDDCFLHDGPIVLRSGRQALRLTSSCTHWVIYDATGHATCVEPQTGPPDGFNLAPCVLEPAQTLEAWFRMEWLTVGGVP